jgi:hypothetical protein
MESRDAVVGLAANDSAHPLDHLSIADDVARSTHHAGDLAGGLEDLVLTEAAEFSGLVKRESAHEEALFAPSAVGGRPNTVLDFEFVAAHTSRSSALASLSDVAEVGGGAPGFDSQVDSQAGGLRWIPLDRSGTEMSSDLRK